MARKRNPKNENDLETIGKILELEESEKDL